MLHIRHLSTVHTAKYVGACRGIEHMHTRYHSPLSPPPPLSPAGPPTMAHVPKAPPPVAT